jgi:hypothetical protein
MPLGQTSYSPYLMPVTAIGHMIKPAAGCMNCGHRGMIWTPASEPAAEIENEILDTLQCPVCGLYTMCSH